MRRRCVEASEPHFFPSSNPSATALASGSQTSSIFSAISSTQMYLDAPYNHTVYVRDIQHTAMIGRAPVERSCSSPCSVTVMQESSIGRTICPHNHAFRWRSPVLIVHRVDEHCAPRTHHDTLLREGSTQDQASCEPLGIYACLQQT